MPGIKPVVGMNQMGNARELAEMLRQMGRGKDTVLAHITPEEAQMLKDMGGSGTINPNTGLPEFLDIYSGDDTATFDYGQVFNAAPSPDFDLNAAISAQQAQDVFYQQPQYGEMPDTAVQAYFEPNRDVEAQMGGFYGGRAPTESEFARAQPQPNIFTRGAQAVESFSQQAKELATKYPNVAKLLSTGAQSLPALLQAAKAKREGAAAAEQFRQLGAPLRAQGEALRQQALSGTLTPQQAAAQEAQRAKLMQAAATRGTTTGTQASMIENQLARQRAQLSETNLNNALKQLNLANAYDEAAIKAKLAADQDVANSLANIFSIIGQSYTGQSAKVAPPPQIPSLAQQPEVTVRPQVRG